ncbi:Hypothetical predicted protein [Mytilus galloprovincialis]|uniref:OTU domain-containing protein n=1 Tax=Mytilus galloprovincialis TaxID=29158 RepID=A0A8B6FSF5_MYTGA|nr:Hypothetical predicted protein [Mytilus galloprovincialis]
MGPPSATKTITGDGNCLFRAISYAISNRQEFFGNVRKAIVDHLMTNTEIFRPFLQPRFITVEQHIQTLKMKERNVWGTELEILACADLLKTDIYTFYNGTWIKYSSSQIYSNNCVNDQAIYLQHKGDINHYEVVANVTKKSRSPNPFQYRQKYVEKFQVDRKSEVTSKKMKVDENQTTGLIYNLGNCNTESKGLSKAEKEKIKYWADDKFRARKTNTLKRKYWENEGIRSKKLCVGIKKYKENETYRENLIQAGIQKYHDDEEYRDALIESGIYKYQEDKGYKDALIESGIEKYKEDKVYRDALIQSGIQKYHHDPEYREKLKQASIEKYKSDVKHKEHVKQTSIHKYKTDENHKEYAKQASKQKYKEDESHKNMKQAVYKSIKTKSK